MLLKIIILVLLAVITYRLIVIMRREADEEKAARAKKESDRENVMVQDPYCKTYFPKHQGVVLRIKKRDLYFCSAECKKAFVDQRSKK